MKKLPKQLFRLLSLHSPSGEEQRVASYVKGSITPYVDSIRYDEYGNLLGELKLGDDPYTILLSAHMDTVASVQPKPTWGLDHTIFTQSDSALGGDDKCGIAAILAVVRNARKTKFTGTIKVIFSREEESGCIGATEAVKLNRAWFDNIDACVVIDRKGSDNVVTGGWSENYCSPKYGEFWLDMAEKLDFKGDIQEGTVSDTMVFSELGINGVNLSAGYYNAHTKNEFIKIDEIERTTRWVLTALDHIQSYEKFPEFEYFDNDISYSALPRGSWYSYPKRTDMGKDRETCDWCWGVYNEKHMYVTEIGYQLCKTCVQYSELEYVELVDYRSQKEKLASPF